MKFCSTKNSRLAVPFAQAVRQGIPQDGGLYIPSSIPRCSPAFLRGIGGLSFQEISFEVGRLLLGGDIPDGDLRTIIEKAFTFDAPLHPLDGRTSVLELFHGPTLAFKDFGARFMAQAMAYIRRNDIAESTILVATSGDTGSAVASAFHGMQGISVVLLYPSGMVSPMQERQLTSFGGNVTALEIGGTFDDCQALVRRAFADRELAQARNLTSANSINVARLLPQTFYYFNAAARLGAASGRTLFSVPSGNLGNLTAGLIAWKMGMPAGHFLAAQNVNDAAVRYLASGRYLPGRTVPTISNAMDVGDPGNLPRIRALFDDDIADIRRAISASATTDDETRGAIARAFALYGYLFDPHGGVGYAALERYRTAHGADIPGVILETAHPAKFIDVLGGDLKGEVRIPARLQDALRGEHPAVKLPASFGDLKAFLAGN
ncbi:MAG TPA: threonine synthase [Bacteroidota bacterium]|nr:threonine synthase [Bacteroidota bacterium]